MMKVISEPNMTSVHFGKSMWSHRSGSLGLSDCFPLGTGRAAERSGDELTLKRTVRAKEPSISITVPPNQFWQKLSSVAFAPSCRLRFI